ncbi:MAG: hypothetical protein LUQ17_03660 [Methanomicrobiales archaeon]|nr:hypothetical protein [Methanomicrobiales archaeon]
MTEEELFDVIVPPGVPRSILAAVLKQYDVTLVKRKETMNFANMDGMERELLAFRGKKEVVEQVEKFIVDELEKFVKKESVEDAGTG